MVAKFKWSLAQFILYRFFYRFFTKNIGYFKVFFLTSVIILAANQAGAQELLYKRTRKPTYERENFVRNEIVLMLSDLFLERILQNKT